MTERLISRLAIIVVAGVLLLGSPGNAISAGDTLALQSQTPFRLPLAPGRDNALSFTFNVNLATAPAVLRVFGYAEGTGAAIALTPDTLVNVGAHQGTSGVQVSGPYTPPASGARWLTVQAVLGPADQPLATAALPPYLIMAAAKGSRAVTYYSSGISPALADGYTKGYDNAWQTIGDLFNSFNDKTYNLFLAGDTDIFEQALIASLAVPAAEAAVDKQAVSAVNSARYNAMVVHLGRAGPDVPVSTIGHEYAENRFNALQPGNQGAGWFWDGMADLLGIRVAEASGSSCDAEGLRIRRWRASANGIRDGSYLPLGGIETRDQWFANFSDSAKIVLQYAEGYTAVEYMEGRLGLPALLKLVTQPKTVGQLGTAVQQATNTTVDQIERDYLASVRASIGQPPPAAQVSVHLDPAGVTSRTTIYLEPHYGPGGSGTGYRTALGIAAGDYLFEIAGDGTVRSLDNKVKLTAYTTTAGVAQEGRVYSGINHPAFQGQAAVDGREEIAMIGIHGRGGVTQRQFVNPTGTTTAAWRIAGAEEEEHEPVWLELDGPYANGAASIEPQAGDCRGPWPDGNRIVASFGAPKSSGPELAGPPNGSTLTNLGADLSWTLPAGSTQYQMQVLPANNDGPAINLIRNADTGFKLQPPVLGQGPYVMLPGMTYNWRIRATSFNGPIDEKSPNWGEWSSKTFKTPAPTSNGLQPVQPAAGASVAAGQPVTLQWEHPDKGLFYWEVEVSGDTRFDMNPATATTFVWFNLVHGGVGAVHNSWQAPALTSGGTYYWRGRPRIQGDGTPVEWGPTWRFTVP